MPTTSALRPLIRQARSAWPLALAAVRARPPIVTVALITCIVATWARLEVGGQLPELRFAVDAFSGRALVNGEPHVLLTAALLSRDLFMVISLSISLLVTLGSYEVLAGHLRAAVLGVVAAVVGPLSVAAGLGLLDALGSNWAADRLGTQDIGASAIVAMSSGAIAGIVRDRRLTWGLVAFLLGGLAVHHQLADWEHLLVFPWGLLAGRLGGRAATREHHPNGRQDRRHGAGHLLAGIPLVAAAIWFSNQQFPAAARYHNAVGRPVSQPRILDTTYPSPALHSRRHVLVLLPAGYLSSTDRFPVIELLHGHVGQPKDLFSLGDLLQSATAPGIAPFIAIIPDGNGPRVGDSWWANIPGQRMGTAASVDLRAWATSRFRTTGSWSYAGLSSGGFGAAYLPLVDSAPVHGVCGLSGYYDATHLGIFRHVSAAARRRASPVRHVDRAAPLTFLAFGATDAVARRNSLSYAKALRAKHHTVIVRRYPGQHQWTVWRPAFRDCFRLIAPAQRGRKDP